MNKIQKISLLFAYGLFVISLSTFAQSNFSKSGISIGVVVEDLDKSLDFYLNVVGMVQTGEFSVDSEKAKQLGLSNGDRFDVKVLKLENSEEAAEWKLMSFGKTTSHEKQQYVPDRNGMRYITLFVKSMAPVLERIKKHKVKTLGETPAMLNETRQFVLIQDPDGNFVELIGPK